MLSLFAGFWLLLFAGLELVFILRSEFRAATAVAFIAIQAEVLFTEVEGAEASAGIARFIFIKSLLLFHDCVSKARA